MIEQTDNGFLFKGIEGRIVEVSTNPLDEGRDRPNREWQHYAENGFRPMDLRTHIQIKKACYDARFSEDDKEREAGEVAIQNLLEKKSIGFVNTTITYQQGSNEVTVSHIKPDGKQETYTTRVPDLTQLKGLVAEEKTSSPLSPYRGHMDFQFARLTDIKSRSEPIPEIFTPFMLTLLGPEFKDAGKVLEYFYYENAKERKQVEARCAKREEGLAKVFFGSGEITEEGVSPGRIESKVNQVFGRQLVKRTPKSRLRRNLADLDSDFSGWGYLGCIMCLPEQRTNMTAMPRFSEWEGGAMIDCGTHLDLKTPIEGTKDWRAHDDKSNADWAARYID